MKGTVTYSTLSRQHHTVPATAIPSLFHMHEFAISTRRVGMVCQRVKRKQHAYNDWNQQFYILSWSSKVFWGCVVLFLQLRFDRDRSQLSTID